MNPQEITDIYENSPSVTVLSTHCGNWELLGGFLGYRTPDGRKVGFGEECITVVYKKLRSEVFEEVFGERLGQERVPLGVDVYAVAARLAYVGVLRSMVINAAVLVGVEDGNAVKISEFV